MRKNRFTGKQIIAILKEHHTGLSAVDLSRKHGISDAPFNKWRAKYCGMDVSDTKKPKTLEDEKVK